MSLLNLPFKIAETAKTNATGYFRLRGLLPGATYAVRVADSSRGDRAVPRARDVAVSTADTQGCDFVVIRRSGKFDIYGTVKADRALLPSIKVRGGGVVGRGCGCAERVWLGGVSFYF
jgi:hypothetical protein